MKKLLSIIGAVLIGMISSHAQNTVSLAWDASPSPNIANYFLQQNSTNIASSAGLTYTLLASNIPVNITNVYTVVAANSSGLLADPSNPIKIFRPSAPTSLVYTADVDSVTLNWTAHPSSAINAYNVYIGTNLNNLTKIASVNGRTTTTYDLSTTNINASATNYIAVTAFNTTPNNSTNAILESSASNVLTISKPAPATNLRITVIIQSSTNLLTWVNETTYTDLYVEVINTSNPKKSYRAQLIPNLDAPVLAASSTIIDNSVLFRSPPLPIGIR